MTISGTDMTVALFAQSRGLRAGETRLRLRSHEQLTERRDRHRPRRDADGEPEALPRSLVPCSSPGADHRARRFRAPGRSERCQARGGPIREADLSARRTYPRAITP